MVARNFGSVRLTPDEHAEVARLFRTKLAAMRTEERTPPRRPRRRSVRVLGVPPAEPPTDDALLSTGEVAALLGVSPSKVAYWNLPCIRTLGGHRRYRWGDVRARLERDKRP
jgi:hypothetical protein